MTESITTGTLPGVSPQARIDMAVAAHSPEEIAGALVEALDDLDRQKAEVLALRDAKDAVERQMAGHARDAATMRETADNLRARVASEQQGLRTFKEAVRDAAKEHADEYEHCYDGVNRWLEELGLEGLEREYEIEVKVVATQTVTVTVSASSEDKARELVLEEQGSRDVEEATSSYDWEIDWDGTSVEYVSEA